MLGKWHVGFYEHRYTPLFRGFESFIGYFGDEEDYYTKNKSNYYDFRHGLEPRYNSKYSTYIYGDEAMTILTDHVDKHNPEPFFIYAAYQAPHVPYEAPANYIQAVPSRVTDPDRIGLAAVMMCLDDTIGEMVEYLKSEDSGYLWKDTMLVFSTDNGGDTRKKASNFPLRGGKTSLFEGGVRSTAFVTGGWLPDKRRGQKMAGLMHVTDWMPTLANIAHVGLDDWVDLDGYDMTDNLLYGEPDKYTPRESIIHNTLSQEETGCTTGVCGAVRWKNWKLVTGYEVMNTDDNLCASSWCENVDENTYPTHTVDCKDGKSNYEYPSIDENLCPYNGEVCLYNLEDDPCEWSDVASENPEIRDQLYQMLLEAEKGAEFPLSLLYPSEIGLANPALYGYFWSPWVNDSTYIGINGNEFSFAVKRRKEQKKDSWHWMGRYLHSFLPVF